MIVVSVIITTYNSAQFIRDTIQSVYNQEGIDRDFKIQLIVVDDQSKDDTVEILKQFPTLEYFVNERNSGGPNVGRNKGLSMVKGAFVTFLDHDDQWKVNRLKAQLKFQNYSIITCGYDIFKDQMPVSTVCNKNEKGWIEYAENETFLSKLARDPQGQICYMGSILLSSKLKHILFEETYGKCDYDYILRILKDNNSVEVCMPLFDRFVESNNLSLNEQYRLQDYSVNNQMFTQFQHEFPEAVKKGKLRLNAALGRYYFQQSKGVEARKYLLKARLGVVNISLILTSFFAKNLVNKFFNVFS